MSAKNIKIPLTNANSVTVSPEMWNQIQKMMSMFQAPAFLTSTESPVVIKEATPADSQALLRSLPTANYVASLPSLPATPLVPLPSNDTVDPTDESLARNAGESTKKDCVGAD
jgi:hypothetical protein